MVTKIILKNSAETGKSPTLDDLDLGELAINTYDGDIYLKQDQDGEMTVVRFTRDNPVENVIFVQKGGSDDNRGDSWDSAYLTIEKALENAWTREGAIVLIEIGPGIYTTRGHLDMPDNSIIHCTYRSVKIRPEPGYEERNVFRMGSGCFIEGPVFEGFRVDRFDDPTEGFAAVFRPGAVIFRTPYVHKIAVRSIPTWTQIAPPLDRDAGNPYVPRGGGVVMADGNVISPYSVYPNIMTWGATPVIHNGIGYVAKNGALINAVNAISIWAHKHFYAISGGQIVLSGCSTQFGDYTLIAEGVRNIVTPYTIESEITANTSAGDIVYSAANTIIDGMWANLVSEGYTTSWPNTYEDFTKTDANLLLRSLTWTLQTGDDKPVNDFSKSFYDTTGNRVFVPASYDYDKCFRDTGLISEAVAYDVMLGSNYRSVNSALSYYRANASLVVTDQLADTLSAITRQKITVGSYLSGNTLIRSDELFDEIVDIITNGPTSANTYTFTDPTSYDTGFENARRLLVNNKLFIQSEVDAWIKYQIANDISPFSSNNAQQYDDVACIRDIGLIIDAIRYDLTYNCNLATYSAASAYFVGATAQYGIGEQQASAAALTRMSIILGYILQAIPVPDITVGNNELQDTTGPGGSSTASVFAQTRVGEIISTINNNGVLPSKILPDTSWVETEYVTAFSAINTNKTTITLDVMEYLAKQTKSLLGAFLNAYDYIENDILNILGQGSYEASIVSNIIVNIKNTLMNPILVEEPSLISAIGHTWTAIMSGVALTKMPPASNKATIQDSILELEKGVVIASGQDDQGSALFVGGLEINADTGELTGPPFQQAVNRIATRAAISRSF